MGLNPTATALPTILRPVDLPRLLKTWQQQLKSAIPPGFPIPAAPLNFSAASAQGGIQLQWSKVNSLGVDGYQILRSANGDFSQVEFSITLNGDGALSYFDALPTTGTGVATKYYKVRALSGNAGSPHCVQGLLTGIVSNTSINTADTTTTSTTNHDTTTTDGTNTAGGRTKNYF